MNHYETLGVEPNASQDELQKAYRRAAMKAHPDREGGSTEAFQQVEAAGRVLLDAVRRKAYDEAGYCESDSTASLPERVELMLLDVMAKTAESKQSFVRGIRECRKQFKSLAQANSLQATELKSRLRELAKVDLKKLTAGKPTALAEKLLARYKQTLEAQLAAKESDSEFVKEALRQLDVFEGVEEEEAEPMRRFEQELIRRFGAMPHSF